MTPVLTLQDFEQTSRTELGKLLSIADEAGEADVQQVRFAAQARAIEDLARTTFRCAAMMARKCDTLEGTAEIWRSMVEYCDGILANLSRLAAEHPARDSKHLHDFALDCRSAAARRMDLHL